MPQACIIARKCDIISEIYHPFRQERISLKNPSFVRQTKEGFFLAGETRFEHATYGFGDRYSTVEPLP